MKRKVEYSTLYHICSTDWKHTTLFTRLFISQDLASTYSGMWHFSLRIFFLSTIYCHGSPQSILWTVQEMGIFNDSKHFVDLPMKVSPGEPRNWPIFVVILKYWQSLGLGRGGGGGGISVLLTCPMQHAWKVPSTEIIIIVTFCQCTMAVCRRLNDGVLIEMASYGILAGQPGVAQAFALRAEVCRFAPLASSAQLSRFPINQSRGEHTPLCRKFALRWTCIKTAFAFGKNVTRVIIHYCVHYQQKKNSKEKKS